VRELIASCGYGPHEPLVVAINDRIHTQGCTRTGAPVTADTVTYLASLSKQFTAACVAILVADGRLDVETPAAKFVPRLPPAIRVRHLLHHTAGLPDDVVVTGDRTSDGILAALPTFDATPGIRYAYSNVGYVCLARIVETVCGAPIGDFARTAVFDPLGMHHTRFWTGPQSWPADAAPLAQAHPAPLSVGDGGAWGTAADLIRWGAGLDVDALGISDLLQTPGWLDDGTAVDYAWGMGVRSVRGHVAYRHGGGWPGTRSMLVRVPAEDLTIVVLALADDTERRVALTDALLSLDDR
jgi:CubicO group peptidase (beta-lactamase class C family)